jgi:hypothetical protein
LVRDHNAPQKHVWRAEIALLTAEGVGTNEIMRLGYRRFTRAADAIRFAIEELPPEFLLGPFSKSTTKDTTGTEFAGRTRAWTIPWSVARRLSDDRSLAQQIRRLQSSI